MPSYRGKNLTISVDGVQIEQVGRSFGIDINSPALDSTVYGADARGKEPGLSEGSLSFEGLDQSGGNWTGDFWEALKPGTKAAWVVRPEGAGSGLRELQFTAVITARNLAIPYDDLATLTASADIDGDVTETTQA